jgi:Fe-S-cluster containining protein
MRQIVHHEQCKRCRECCRFRANRQDFAPIFTVEELQAIREVRESLPEFLPFKETTNVYQIRLKEAEHSDPAYPYVCPFLDEENYQCTIYDVRPFDCRIWPFIVLKNDEGKISLQHFTGNACLALQEVSPEDFREYEAYMEKLVSSSSFLEFLKRHPELIWPQEDQHGKYVTIPSREITSLFVETTGD